MVSVRPEHLDRIWLRLSQHNLGYPYQTWRHYEVKIKNSILYKV